MAYICQMVVTVTLNLLFVKMMKSDTTFRLYVMRRSVSGVVISLGRRKEEGGRGQGSLCLQR